MANPLNEQESIPREPVVLTLGRKLILLFLIMLAAPIGLVFLLVRVRWQMPYLARLIADAAIGLVMGFSVRWILPKNSWLRIAAVILFNIGGLAFLGWFTGWDFGVDFFRRGYNPVDLMEAGQVLFSTAIALLTLIAWKNAARSSTESKTAATSRKFPRSRRKPRKQPSRARSPAPIRSVPALATTPIKTAISKQVSKQKKRGAKPVKPRLLLSSQEEHRCPYCLELILPDDPRGVVECEICHTLHHADCWAITGACQVPHYTT